MRLYLLLFLTLSSFLPLMAQRNFAKYMIVGTSLTYIREHIPPDNSNFDEYVWNVNTGISVSKRLFTGIQVLSIKTSYLSVKQQYNVYGLFAQYNFLRSRERRFFVEASLNRGDYDVRLKVPFRKLTENLCYVGYGLGYDYPLKIIPNLFIDFSVMTYRIINKLETESFLQYIIGLNYKLN